MSLGLDPGPYTHLARTLPLDRLLSSLSAFHLDTGSHSRAQADLESLILLSQLPKYLEIVRMYGQASQNPYSKVRPCDLLGSYCLLDIGYLGLIPQGSDAWSSTPHIAVWYLGSSHEL